MSDPVPPLVLDLLEWLVPGPRPYREALEVWRTSCPRLPVWETANSLGLLEHLHTPGSPAWVALSQKGREHLAANRPGLDLAVRRRGVDRAASRVER